MMPKFASIMVVGMGLAPLPSLAFDAPEPVETTPTLGSCRTYMKLDTAAEIAMIVLSSGLDENTHARASLVEFGLPEGREHLANIPELSAQFLRKHCGLSYVSNLTYSFGAQPFDAENFIGFSFIARDRATATTNRYVFGFAGKTDTEIAALTLDGTALSPNESVRQLRIDGQYGWKIHAQYLATDDLLERFATTPYGATQYEDGTYFEGFLKPDGSPSGTGIHLMSDGTAANLRNVDGEIHGWGHVIDRHGDEYIGDFLHGDRTGMGTLKLASGEMWCYGEFKNGVMQGVGEGMRKGKKVHCGLRENGTMWSEPIE